MKHSLKTKLYYSISEVARLTELQPYTLRAWEKEFSSLKPRRARGKNRAYREKDIGIILLIKHLLHRERYTIAGVRQKIDSEPELLRHASENVDQWRKAARQGSVPDLPNIALLSKNADHGAVEQNQRAANLQEDDAVGRKGPNEAEMRTLLESTRNELRAILKNL